MDMGCCYSEFHAFLTKFVCALFLEPQFVGSFDVGDQVYFFFREVALEYTNCGKKIYSRVAKVCKVSVYIG